MKKNPYRLLIPALCLLSCLFTACVSFTPPRPIFQSAAFDPNLVNEIVILPAIDLRLDKRVSPDANLLGQRLAKRFLDTRKKAMRYKSRLETTAIAQGVTDEDLKNPPAGWVSALPPAGANWILLVTVNRIDQKLTFGSTGNAEVSVFLYDKANGVLVWRNTGIGQVGQGGLIGMAMVGAMGNAALDAAVVNAMGALPLPNR